MAWRCQLEKGVIFFLDFFDAVVVAASTFLNIMHASSFSAHCLRVVALPAEVFRPSRRARCVHSKSHVRGVSHVAVAIVFVRAVL